MTEAWHVVEPGTNLVPGIHLDAICEHLQAVTEGKIRNLIINVPPGHAKSLLTAVLWPCWAWIDNPGTRWLFASYSAVLSVRDSVRCRRLIESQWYQQRWGDKFQLAIDENQKQRFSNNRAGYRIATSVGGSGTGERANICCVDDPVSVDQAASDLERTTANEWYLGTMSTRLNDFRTGHFVVIMQRLHENDLTGELLRRGGYEHLCLPMEFEVERKCTTSIGWTDPRTEPGQLLWPEKIRPEDIESLKATLGGFRFAGQYAQRPSPADGGILQRHWWRYWAPRDMKLPPVLVRQPDGTLASIEAVPLPDKFDIQIQSWDLAFKDLKTSDFVAAGVWGAVKADRFLLARLKRRLDMPGSLAAIRKMSEDWPEARTILIEDAANGPAVIQTLKKEIAGIVAVHPEGGKIARAQAVSPQIESGNVYLPHPHIAPWVNECLEEMTSFPNGKNDDEVDQMSMALNRLQRKRNLFQPPIISIVKQSYWSGGGLGESGDRWP